MKINLLVIFSLFLMVSGCATIPPEFLTAMEKEKEGVALLNKRHQQTVNDLVENWYNERIERVNFVKQLEIDKITLKVNDPNGGNQIDVIKSGELKKINQQYKQAVDDADKLKTVLIEGYLDEQNWTKLIKLNSYNVEMARSLKDLNAAQSKLYTELVGQNTPLPTDFLNNEAKKLLPK